MENNFLEADADPPPVLSTSLFIHILLWNFLGHMATLAKKERKKK
jgi:hypothetical protein